MTGEEAQAYGLIDRVVQSRATESRPPGDGSGKANAATTARTAEERA